MEALCHLWVTVVCASCQQLETLVVNRVRGLGATHWGGLHWVQLKTEGLRVVYWTGNRFKPATSETHDLSRVTGSSTSLNQLTERLVCVCFRMHEAAGRHSGPKQLQMYV